VKPDLEAVRLFELEWEYGWYSSNPVMREANRLTMRQQLLALIDGHEKPLGIGAELLKPKE
jgi:hypothetical protein